MTSRTRLLVLWSTAASALTAAAVLCVSLLSWHFDADTRRAEACYRRVELGMAVDQAREIMGPEEIPAGRLGFKGVVVFYSHRVDGEEVENFPQIYAECERCDWRQGKCRVIVYSKNGMVVAKHQIRVVRRTFFQQLIDKLLAAF